jgi:hypothetical protein
VKNATGDAEFCTWLGLRYAGLASEAATVAKVCHQETGL